MRKLFTSERRTHVLWAIALKVIAVMLTALSAALIAWEEDLSLGSATASDSPPVKGQACP